MHARKLLALGLAASACALAALAADAPATAATAFRDVLDSPALKSPQATRGLFNGLAQAGSRIVAVGQRGHIVFSDDAGKNWQQADVPVSSDLVAVMFPTVLHGWAVGHDGVILKSSDGARTWQRQRDGRPAAADVPLLDVYFSDERNGHAVGAFGLILRTTDGGAHWEEVKDVDNPKNLHLYAVRRVAGDLFMAGEQGLLLKQDPVTGRLRALETPYKGTFFGLTGNARAVVAHGLRGNVVRSTDRGASWQPVETGIQVGLTGSATDTRGRIVLASQAGHLLTSTDDGATFTPLRQERPFPAAAVLAAASGGLVVAGPRGLHTLPRP